MYSLHNFFYSFISKKRLVLSDPNDFSGIIDSGNKEKKMERKRNENLKLTIETLFKTWLLLFFECPFHLYHVKSVLCHYDVEKFDLCVFLFFQFYWAIVGQSILAFNVKFYFFLSLFPTLMHGNDNNGPNNRESLLFLDVFFFIA